MVFLSGFTFLFDNTSGKPDQGQAALDFLFYSASACLPKVAMNYTKMNIYLRANFMTFKRLFRSTDVIPFIYTSYCRVIYASCIFAKSMLHELVNAADILPLE